jgi:hypothetical protein
MTPGVETAGDRPANESRDIVITPEMVQAGFRVFVAAAITDDPMEADRLTVAEIYRAMALLRQDA